MQLKTDKCNFIHLGRCVKSTAQNIPHDSPPDWSSPGLKHLLLATSLIAPGWLSALPGANSPVICPSLTTAVETNQRREGKETGEQEMELPRGDGGVPNGWGGGELKKWEPESWG